MTADPPANPHCDPRLKAEWEQRRRDEALARAQMRLGRMEQHGQNPVQAPAVAPVQAASAPVQQAQVVLPPHVEPPTARLDPEPHHTPQAVPPRPVVPDNPNLQPPQAGLNTRNPATVQQPALPGQTGQMADHDTSLDFLGGERDARDFLRANRHSGRVRVLRIALPLVGLFILSVVVGAYFWSQSGAPSVTIQSASMDDGRMVMSNPKIDGVDDRQRPYTLIAREAIQDPAELGKVELTEIDAKVPIDEGIFAKILAGKGFYDSDAKTLKLDQSVDITTDDGVTMTLQDADVDMDAGKLITENPVSIKTEQAEVSAQSFVVENNGEKVVFQNRVRMIIYPGKFDRAERDSISQLLQSDEQN